MDTFNLIMMFLLPLILMVSLLLVVVFAITKKKSKAIKASYVFGFTLISLLAFETTEFWQIDTCLDSGGKYDYEQSKCIK